MSTLRYNFMKSALRDLHWMARRYADGRQSYVTSMFNDITRELITMGIKLNPTADMKIFARDAMGDSFAGLTEKDLDVEKAICEKHGKLEVTK